MTPRAARKAAGPRPTGFAPRDEDLFVLPRHTAEYAPTLRRQASPRERHALRVRLEPLWPELDARALLARPSEADRGVTPRPASVVSVCPRTTFTFAVPDAGLTIVPLRERIPVTDWTRGMLVVRVHDVPSPADTTLEIASQNMSLCRDDPSVTFVASGDSAVVSFTGTTAFVGGRVRLASLVGPIGPMQRVVLRLSGAKALGTLTVAISVDLVGRTG